MISQKIIDYAIWYYLKYYPSKKKLTQKLKEKFGPNSENGKKYGGISAKDINHILNENMKSIINEEEVLKSKIKNLKNKGKNIYYIRGNLLKKGFLLDEISTILEKDFKIEEESFLDKQAIIKKIELYKNKGKSKNFIRQKFIERSLDKEIIEEILTEVYGFSEEEILKKELEKLKGNFEKQKIIEKLLRKGFLYDDIKKVLNI